MNTIKLNTLGDKVIVRKTAENGGNAGGDNGGSGGGSGSEENKVVYLNIAPCVAAMGSQFGNAIKTLPGFLAMKVSDGDVINILPPSAIASEHYASVTEAALLPNFRGYIQPDHLNDVNSDATINQFKLMGATEITEEQFYNLES